MVMIYLWFDDRIWDVDDKENIGDSRNLLNMEIGIRYLDWVGV